MLLRRRRHPTATATAVSIEWVALEKAAVAPPSTAAAAAATAVPGGEAGLALGGAGVPAKVRSRSARINKSQ